MACYEGKKISNLDIHLIPTLVISKNSLPMPSFIVEKIGAPSFLIYAIEESYLSHEFILQETLSSI